MAAFDYLLSFGGIPFLSDVAQNAGLRMPPGGLQDAVVGGSPHVGDPRILGRKQQSQADLLEEVDRLIPWDFHREFVYPLGPIGKKLADIAARYPLAQPLFPPIKMGQWFYPTGVSRWSVFRGLATSSCAAAMLDATQGNKALPFTMMSVPAGVANVSDGAYTLTTDMFMLPPRPLGETKGSLDGLYLITLVDERFYWQFDTVQIHPTKDTTWSAIITQLGLELGFSPNFGPAIASVYTSPEPDSPFWMNFESAAVVMDAVAANLGATWVRGLDGNYNLYQPIFSRQLAYFNRARVSNPNIAVTGLSTIADGAFLVGPGGVLTINWSLIQATVGLSFDPVRIAGGDLFASGVEGKLPAGDLIASMNSVLPSQVSISYPKYVIGDDPVPHFSNPRYTNQRPSAWIEDSYGDTYVINVPLLSGGLQFSGQLGVQISGGLQVINGIPTVTSGLTGNPSFTPTIKETAKALYSGEVQLASQPLNVSGLTSLSMQLAYDFFNQQIDAALDEVYQGTFFWTPEGIHDIIWTYSDKARLASTRVIRSVWNSYAREMQHTAAALSGSTTCMRGVGGPSVAQTWRDGDKGPAGGQFSGYVTTTLSRTLLATDFNAFFTAPDNLPTQNRWRGKIDNEIIYFEGTSGNISGGAQIVYRGIDSTIPAIHANNATVIELKPHTQYGVNLVTSEKGGFIYPQEWSSGGIQGVNLVPQTQTVYVFDGSGTIPTQADALGLVFRSGQLNTWDPVNGIYVMGEYIWIIERWYRALQSGSYYDGQFVGYSPTIPQGTGTVAPTYLIDGFNLSFQNAPITTTVSGVMNVIIDESTKILKLEDLGHQTVEITAKVDNHIVPECCPTFFEVTCIEIINGVCFYCISEVTWDGTKWVIVPDGIITFGQEFNGNCDVPIGTIVPGNNINGFWFFLFCCFGFPVGFGSGGGSGGGGGGGGGGGSGGSGGAG